MEHNQKLYESLQNNNSNFHREMSHLLNNGSNCKDVINGLMCEMKSVYPLIQRCLHSSS